MKNITIYSKPSCGFCRMAKQLLEKKGVEFEEIRVDQSDERREEMIQRTQRFTVPQIFIGDQHIGGCDELYELEMTGKLEPLLIPYRNNEPE